jgi:ankyrin repeat protein
MPELPKSELLQALYTGDEEKAEALLRAEPELDIFEAAAAGKTERVRELLAADPQAANAWAEDGFQPLGLAVFFGHPQPARVLVEAGADVNSASRNDFKVTPLHSACAVGDPEKRYELAKLLLEHGADPNARQQDDVTPLMEADQHGDRRLRALLVEHGADD